jgi:hypothetical protein
MQRITLIAALLALAGCAAPTVYRDPATGNVAQCNAATPGIFPIIAQNEINNCSQAYERMGWKKQ